MKESLEIVLRPVTYADVDTLFEHQADPVASAMAAFPSRDIDAHREHWNKLLADPSKITRAIVVNGIVVGNIGSSRTRAGGAALRGVPTRDLEVV